MSSCTTFCGRLARGWNWLTTMPSTSRSRLWSALISCTFSSSEYSALRENSSQSKGIRQASAAISAERVKKLSAGGVSMKTQSKSFASSSSASRSL